MPAPPASGDQPQLVLRNVEEAVVAGGVRYESLDVRADAVVLGGHQEEEPRGFLANDLLGLVVRLDALLFGLGGAPDFEEFVDTRGGPEGAVTRIAVLAGVEQRVEAVVGITGNGYPAKNEHVVVACCRLGQVGAPLDDLDSCIDTYVGKLCLHDLGNLDAQRVVVRPDGGGEAILKTCLGQKLAGALRVVGVGLEVGVCTEDSLGDGAVCRNGLAHVDRFDDGFDVDGVVDRLAHADIIERLLLGVDAQVGGGQRFYRNDLHVGVAAALEALRVDGFEGVSDVNTTGLEFDRAHGALGDGAEDDLLGKNFATPPVVVPLEDDLVGGLPADELEGAGTDGDFRAVVIPGLGDSLFIEDRGRVVGQVSQQRGERVLRIQLHRVLVDSLDALDEVNDERRRGGHLRVAQPLEGEDHIVGRELFTVVELDTLADVEDPGGVVDLFPRLGQAGFQFEVFVLDDQRVVDLGADPGRGLVVLTLRVKSDSVSALRDGDRLRDGTAKQSEGRD